MIFFFLMNDVISASGVQQTESVTYTHVSLLFQTLFPPRSLQNTEQSSLRYTAGPCWLHILNTAVYTYQSPTPYITILNCSLLVSK